MPLPHIGLQPRRSKVFLRRGQISALIAYVASLGERPADPDAPPRAGRPRRGPEDVHRPLRGLPPGRRRGRVRDGRASRRRSRTPRSRQIAEAVRIGPYVMPRFSRKSLTTHELDSIIAYVQYAKHPDDRGGWALGHLGPVPEGLVTWFLAAIVLIFTCMTIGKRFGHE